MGDAWHEARVACSAWRGARDMRWVGSAWHVTQSTGCSAASQSSHPSSIISTVIIATISPVIARALLHRTATNRYAPPLHKH